MAIYHPYFRGKQYELVTVRESAPLLSEADFIPIIEPVAESFSGLTRALQAIEEASGSAILVVNPGYGHHAESAEEIERLFAGHLTKMDCVVAGVIASGDMTAQQVATLCEKYEHRELAIVHDGFADGRELAGALGKAADKMVHVFLEQQHGKVYMRHFPRGKRILVRDGFKKRKNREYPPVEKFSDLHLTYSEEGAAGFGDFLIVGDEFSESGGPAYAVAIHLTFIDATKDEEMYIYHFVSDRSDTPTDPAGKFAEALEKLVREVRRRGSQIMKTEAVKEFLDLYERKHFPGLGYVKKLSMKHHLETLAIYLTPRE